MLQDDWLMRQVEDLATCLAAMTTHKRASQHHEAQTALETASRRMLGLDPDLLARLPLAQIVHLWTHAGTLDAGRAALGARILYEDAEIQRLFGRAEAAATRLRKAADLLAATFATAPSLAEGEWADLARTLGVPLPPPPEIAGT